MKRSIRRMFSLLALLVFAAGLAASAGAESAVDTILATGTTQAFASDAVPDEDIQTILQAGVSTSSAINQQPWYFAAVTNRDLMKEISSGSGMGFGGRPEGMGTPPDGAGSPPEGMSIPEGMAPPPGGMPEGGSMPAMPSMPGGGAGGAKASLGDSPLAIIVYMDTNSKSPSPEYDCGLATQNMVIAASALGYGVKIVSSPTMTLNGDKHDEICRKLGVDTSLKAVAVLLIGKPAEGVDATTGASVREAVDSKSVILH